MAPENTSTTAVAVVAGLGPGLSASLCRKLDAQGYAVAGLARRAEFGVSLAEEVTGGGGRMIFYPCDLADPESINRVCSGIESDLGMPHILIYTAGTFAMQGLLDTRPEDMRRLWEINCFGAFLCARRMLAGMLQQRRGTMIFTGATAAVKPGVNFSGFGSSKFALRGFAQALARELGPQGIHVAHVVIDGIIDTQRTRESFGIDGANCLRPDAIAESYLHLIRQDRSAWTFELDLRPDREPF